MAAAALERAVSGNPCRCAWRGRHTRPSRQDRRRLRAHSPPTCAGRGTNAAETAVPAPSPPLSGWQAPSPDIEELASCHLSMLTSQLSAPTSLKAYVRTVAEEGGLNLQLVAETKGASATVVRAQGQGGTLDLSLLARAESAASASAAVEESLVSQQAVELPSAALVVPLVAEAPGGGLALVGLLVAERFEWEVETHEGGVVFEAEERAALGAHARALAIAAKMEINRIYAAAARRALGGGLSEARGQLRAIRTLSALIGQQSGGSEGGIVYDLTEDIDRQTGQLAEVVEALEAALHPAERTDVTAAPRLRGAAPAAAAPGKLLKLPAGAGAPEGSGAAPELEVEQKISGAVDPTSDTTQIGANFDKSTPLASSAPRRAGSAAMTPGAPLGGGAQAPFLPTLLDDRFNTDAPTGNAFASHSVGSSGGTAAPSVVSGERCDLMTFLPQLCAAAEGMAGAQGLRFESRLDKGLPPVCTSLSVTREAVRAALDAALRAAAPSSELTLEVAADGGSAGISLSISYTQAGARAHAGGQDGYGLRAAAAALSSYGGSLTHECSSAASHQNDAMSLYQQTFAGHTTTTAHAAGIFLWLPAPETGGEDEMAGVDASEADRSIDVSMASASR